MRQKEMAAAKQHRWHHAANKDQVFAPDRHLETIETSIAVNRHQLQEPEIVSWRRHTFLVTTVHERLGLSAYV